MENEQADAGRDGRTCLARPNSQARPGIGKYQFSLLFSCAIIVLSKATEGK